jgi:hypothetical protein
MRTFWKITATFGVVGAIAASSALPASADWYGRHIITAIIIITMAATERGMAARWIGLFRAASVKAVSARPVGYLGWAAERLRILRNTEAASAAFSF